MLLVASTHRILEKHLFFIVLFMLVHNSQYLLFSQQAVWVLKNKVFGQESTKRNCEIAVVEAKMQSLFVPFGEVAFSNSGSNKLLKIKS